MPSSAHLDSAPPVAIAPAPHPRLCLASPPPTELAPGLRALIAALPAPFTTTPGEVALSLQFKPRSLHPVGPTLVIRFPSAHTCIIDYVTPGDAFRGLGILLGHLRNATPLRPHVENRTFDSLGVMLDVSRNAVLQPQAVQKLIRHLALMGLNQLMLYTEDTYEIPGEPLFGYFRGGYSQAELTALDDYAALFGIEIVPCIQTLGHLEQVLQWPPYQKMQDTAGVLLVNDPASDAFVEKMITAASTPFRSRRIHLGMDEAHGIGAGQYRLRHGVRPPFDILTDHLARTTALCERLGLQPMIWSDMFFRLGSKTNNYYDPASVISPEVAARVPRDVDLVYWDYYHTDSAFYDDWIARHRAMGKEPIFAGGIWTWNRWWAQLPHSFDTLRAGMISARANGLKQAFVTMWGDDGMECDVFSCLPALQFFAELGHGTAETADENLAIHLLGSSHANAAAWTAAGRIDLTPHATALPFDHANPSKWLLWHDPLLGFLDQHITPEFPAHFNDIARGCAEWCDPDSEDVRLLFIGRVASVLALKSSLHLALRPAYQNGDHATLLSLLNHTLPELAQQISSLQALHETRWHEIYRPFGWEVLERRYAGLLSRLQTLTRKLRLHLAPPHPPIPELACPTHPVWPAASTFSTTLTHHQAVTPSRIL